MKLSRILLAACLIAIPAVTGTAMAGEPFHPIVDTSWSFDFTWSFYYYF